jgi:hypothetical protein
VLKFDLEASSAERIVEQLLPSLDIVHGGDFAIDIGQQPFGIVACLADERCRARGIGRSPTQKQVAIFEIDRAESPPI